MPRASYVPKMDWEIGSGDAASPLNMLPHQEHRDRKPIRFLCPEPKLSGEERDRLLSRHCQRKGKRHDFSLTSREGVKCIWCGITRADVN